MDQWGCSVLASSPPGLSLANVYASDVITATLDDVWRTVRRWSAPAWLKGDAQTTFAVAHMDGQAPTEVGSLRTVRVCEGQIFEQLTAMDDEEHFLRWKLISHPQTLSPFSNASFVNHVTSIHLKPVTTGDRTFVEWKGRFFTEPHNMQVMQAKLQQWCHLGVSNLQDFFSTRQGYLQQTSARYPISAPAFPHPSFFTPGAPLGVSAAGVAQPDVKTIGTYLRPQNLSGPYTAQAQYATRGVAQEAVTDFCRLAPGGPAAVRVTGAAPQAPEAAPKARQSASVLPPVAAFNVRPDETWQSWHKPASQHTPLPQGPGPPLAAGKTGKDASMPSSMDQSTGSSQSSDSRSTSWESENAQREQILRHLRSEPADSRSMDERISPTLQTFSSQNLSSVATTTPSTTTPSMSSHASRPSEPAPVAPASVAPHASKPRPSFDGRAQSAAADNPAALDELAQRVQAWATEEEAEETPPRTSLEKLAAEFEARYKQIHKPQAQQKQQVPFTSPFQTGVGPPPPTHNAHEHPQAGVAAVPPSSSGMLAAGTPFSHPRRRQPVFPPEAAAAFWRPQM